MAEVNHLLAGIPQSGNSLGSPTAPVTLQYYGDLECPICRKFTLGALPPLIRTGSEQGKLRIEYHNLETATREPETFKSQQAAALAAGKQAKMWNFIETFYHEQGAEDSGYVTEQYLRGTRRTGHRAEPREMGQRTHEPRIRANDRSRRAGSQRRRLHRYPVLPDRPHRRGPENARIRLAGRPDGFNEAIEKQLKA